MFIDWTQSVMSENGISLVYVSPIDKNRLAFLVVEVELFSSYYAWFSL